MKYYVINKSIYIIKETLCHEGFLTNKMTMQSSIVFEINSNGTVEFTKNRFSGIMHFLSLDRALKFIRAYDALGTSETVHNIRSIEELSFVLSI